VAALQVAFKQQRGWRNAEMEGYFVNTDFKITAYLQSFVKSSFSNILRSMKMFRHHFITVRLVPS
jgi:hypothetical protein